MSGYTFGAEPRVVKNKAKYKLNEDDNSKKQVSPLDMAEDAIKNEREKRKIELLKQQLVEFKKDKTKKTPYDLRPAPPPKIGVDLTYFLTEQNVQQSTVANLDTQTDDILDGPAEEPYLPQKKGVDVSTQIWDYDLFNYDREVEPILSVLVSKTLEQARLEVDEDAEIEAIRKYKGEYAERRQIERDDMEAIVEEERKRLIKKNELLEREREKREKQEVALRKLQCLHIAKAYLKNTLHNSMETMISSNFWQNEELEEIHNDYIPKVVENVSQSLSKKENIVESLHNFALSALSEPTKMLDVVKAKSQAKQDEKKIHRKMQDQRYREVRLLFSNLTKPKMSKFGMYMRKSLVGKLEEWENETKENYSKLHEKFFQGEENIEELIEQYNDQLLPSSVDFMMDINSIPNLSFAVASDPYDYLAEHYHRYWPEIFVFGQEGEFLGKQTIKQRPDKFGKFLKSAELRRDKILRENDDSKIYINLKAVPEDVKMLILGIKEDPLHKQAQEAWFGNARYRILDEETFQSVQYNGLIELLEKSQKLSEANPEEGQIETRTIICGRLYKDESKNSWIYESYNQALSGKAEEIQNRITGLTDLLKREELPAINIEKWSEEFEQQKILASKSKKGGRREETKAGKSNKSKVEDSKRKDKSQYEQDENQELDQSVHQKLQGLLNFPIGPLSIDCEHPAEEIESQIINYLASSHKEILDSCLYGVEVFLNDQQLKTGKQILRHSYILPRFIIRPKEQKIIAPAELAEDAEEVLEEQPSE